MIARPFVTQRAVDQDALLLSHWEVDSDAADKLVTAAVQAMSKTEGVGRAEALRRAMLATMSNTSRPTNWTPAWHPSVWAPFAAVGRHTKKLNERLRFERAPSSRVLKCSVPDRCDRLGPRLRSER